MQRLQKWGEGVKDHRQSDLPRICNAWLLRARPRSCVHGPRLSPVTRPVRDRDDKSFQPPVSLSPVDATLTKNRGYPKATTSQGRTSSISTTSEFSCTRSRTTSRPSGEM